MEPEEEEEKGAVSSTEGLREGEAGKRGVRPGSVFKDPGAGSWP